MTEQIIKKLHGIFSCVILVVVFGGPVYAQHKPVPSSIGWQQSPLVFVRQGDSVYQPGDTILGTVSLIPGSRPVGAGIASFALVDAVSREIVLFQKRKLAGKLDVVRLPIPKYVESRDYWLVFSYGGGGLDGFTDASRSRILIRSYQEDPIRILSQEIVRWSRDSVTVVVRLGTACGWVPAGHHFRLEASGKDGYSFSDTLIIGKSGDIRLNLPIAMADQSSYSVAGYVDMGYFSRNCSFQVFTKPDKRDGKQLELEWRTRIDVHDLAPYALKHN